MSGTAQARKRIRTLGYIGMNGSGKTWLGLQESRHEPRIVRVRLNPRDDTLLEGGALVVSKISTLRQYMADNAHGRYRLCFDLYRHSDIKRAWRMLAGSVLAQGRVALHADEAHRYCERNIDAQPELNELLSQNFHFRVPFYWTATAPRQLSPEFRQQSHELKIFMNGDPAYQSYIREVAGSKLLEELGQMPDYSYILLSPKGPIGVKKPHKLRQNVAIKPL